MGWKSSIMQHAIQNGGETIGKVIFHSEIFILAIIDRQGIDRALTYFIVNIIVCGAVIFAGFFIGTLLTGGFW